VTRTAAYVSNIQYAALPWRRTERGLEILLITTLNTKSWIVPKGWPIANRTPRECAAHEALEEAGVVGELAQEPLGSFDYNKRRKSGEIVVCKVHVFAMEVVQQLHSWAEQAAREVRWCSLDEALALVTEPSLRRLIAKFAKTLGEPVERRVPNRTAAPM
jgi:ADP-ribose pyrophosphatase YjhB (NUDIX family)